MTFRIYGEAPSRASDPRRPLGGRSGALVAELVGAPLEAMAAYLGEAVVVRNLLDAWPGPTAKGSAFDREAAKRRAEREARGFRDGDRVLLLGRRVARAFGIRAPYLAGFLFDFPRRRVEGLVLPHPSGVNRWWNEPANREAAREVLRHFAAAEGGAP